MPWEMKKDHPDCSGVAVVKSDTGEMVSCHTGDDAETKAKKQIAALYANENSEREHFERAVDGAAWDGNKAMGQCSDASCYRSICAGEKNVGEPDERQHWALPHHYPGSGPNAAGVRNALSRLSQTEGLKDAGAARRHLEGHMAAISGEKNVEPNGSERRRPPRENLVRAMPGRFEVRESDDAGSIGLLSGYMAVTGQWTEIDSAFEGHFMELNEPGFAEQTIRENRKAMKILFNHGHDPSIGDKVLGPLRDIREDDVGVFYEVPLFDTSYNRDLLPGLKSPEPVYGSSYRFTVTADEWERDPGESDHNPKGLPERRVTKARIMEGGPVTFPAYAGATAAARSMTDEFLFEGLVEDAKNRSKLVTFARTIQGEASNAEGKTEAAAEVRTEQTESRKEATVEEAKTIEEPNVDKFPTVGDLEHRAREIGDRLTQIDADAKGRARTTEELTEWEALKLEANAIEKRKKEFLDREADLQALVNGTEPPERKAGQVRAVGTESGYSKPIQTITRTADPFDLVTTRAESRTDDEYASKMRSNARTVLERSRFIEAGMSREEAQDRVDYLIERMDHKVPWMSEWVLVTGSELYARAFEKYLKGWIRTPQEEAALARAQQMEAERALSLAGASGGFAVPFELDPTILGTSNGAVNPMREISRVINVSVDEWRGVSSAGITMGYGTEASEAGDNAPTLVQPTISTERGYGFVPFSIEVGMDWPTLRSEMSRLFQEGKDELEADKFINGTGTNEPFGLLVGVTNTVNAAAGADAFTLANLYSLKNALPPRYRPSSRYVADGAILDRIRQFDTVGSSAAIWVDGLQADTPGRLLGRPAHEASAMPDTALTGNKFLVLGDFSRYVIIERVGMTVELIDHLVGTNHRPTGQRGLYAFFRNGAKVVDANAFRSMLGTA